MSSSYDSERKRGWFWWTQRKDQELRWRTCEEFFACQEGSAAETLETGKRIAMAMWLVSVLCLLGYSIMVLIMEHSVRHHQCEEIYNLWFVMLLDCVAYGLMLIVYILFSNPVWFRAAGCFFVVYLGILVVWFCLIASQMAPICTTFYHIKYSLLKQAFTLFGVLNAGFLFMWTFYSCYTNFSCCFDQKKEDPIMFTTIFYTKDQTWVSPLFEPTDVVKYSEGVNKWGTSAEQRVAQLHTTLTKAEEIRTTSERQSTLLRQVTNLVVETEEKVTRTANLIDQQETQIRDFQNSIEDAKLKLDIQLDQKGGYNIPWPNSGDVLCWLLVIFMCCSFFICLNFAANKWADEFEIELPTNVVL